MTQVNRRLAICRIGLHTASSPYTGVWTPQTLAWLFDPGNPVGLTAYWHQATGGVVTVSTELLDLGVIPSDLLVASVRNENRRIGLTACAATAAALDIDLAGYDGVVFCIQGAPANSGAGGIAVDGKRVRAALLDELGSHSFMAHELGHVLGLDHAFRAAYTGSRHGEYGDPTCIMSAESYGGEPVTFALAADAASGIPGNARFWQSAGPGVSTATLWRYTGDFVTLPGVRVPLAWPAYVRPVLADAREEEVTINRPGLGGTTLIVIHDESSHRFHTVEYRPAVDWDRALGTSGREISDPGVVIHELRDFGKASDGAGWPKPDRLDYRWTLHPGDSDWDNGHFGVRLVDAGPDRATVLIGRELTHTRGIRVVRREVALARNRAPDRTVHRCDERTHL